MAPSLAGALVFFTSAAILVLEILAARLLAPYVGVTLETYTAVIGTVLAGIAAGTWLGGQVADRRNPRRLLGPLLVLGGALSMGVVPIVRTLGPPVVGGGAVAGVLLAVSGFFLPAAVLSAVSPAVVKLQLRDLGVTGSVVGRLSALGTAGAILGTFFAGFWLVEHAPTSGSILGIGAALVVVGALTWAALARRGAGAVAAAVVVAVGGSAFAGRAAGPCDVETVYHCADVVPDEERPGGRLLRLDTLRHSYVDLDDPTWLEFRYAQVFADVAAAGPPGPVRALHIGGGGFTLPRYLRAARPGSESVVLEIDPGLVSLSRDRLGLRTGPDLEVRVGDARLLAGELPAGSFDLALGDAFGGLAVPWHLTTAEFVRAVRDALRPGGIYMLNLIDYPPMRFARAEAATLRSVFGNVAVIAPPNLLAGTAQGNVVLAASTGPLDVRAIEDAIAAREGVEEILTGAAADAFIAGAPVLIDDHAPVDQWLARARWGWTEPTPAGRG